MSEGCIELKGVIRAKRTSSSKKEVIAMKNACCIITAFAIVLILAAANAPAEETQENKVESYLRVAEKLIEMRMYNEALNVLLETKELDPSHEKTQDLLLKVTSEIAKKIKSAKARPIRKEDLEKLIPEVDFTDARLEEVVNYLSQRCEVNIVIHEQARKTPVPRPVPSGTDEFNEFDELAKPGDEGLEQPEELIEEPEPPDIGGITIRLKDAPLKAVLKYVLQVKGLTYIVEDYAIVIVPQGYVPEEDMQTEIYHLYHSGEGARDYLRHGF